MDEHDRGALVQHRKQGIEPRIAEEIFAVARKQRDAVELERVVFGTDYPFANPRVIAEMIKTYESGFLSDARRAEIDRANALALFPKYA